MFVIVNVYVSTNSTKGSLQGARTDDLLSLILAELDARPLGPKAILGDLNGDPDSFPFVYLRCMKGAMLMLDRARISEDHLGSPVVTRPGI